MEHYVTLFDKLFLPQGLALHMSMERHAGPYTLWILCVDDETFHMLARSKLPNVRLLQLSKLETDELKRIKPDRTKGEYCWTLTPFAPRFVFQADPSVPRVTYLDADMWFRKNPAPIFNEFDASSKHVLITEHAYAPKYDFSAANGQYCVQFMTFTQHGAEVVRKWWEERCVEWCYARIENGKFGDQKYLDDWPERFEQQVHVLNNKELIIAPWNASRFPYGSAILFHFHDLRMANPTTFHLGTYALPKVLVKYIYLPYVKCLSRKARELSDLGIKVSSQYSPTFLQRVKGLLFGRTIRLSGLARILTRAV